MHGWSGAQFRGESCPPQVSESLEGTEQAQLMAPAFPKYGKDHTLVQTICSLLCICFYI